MTQDVKPSTAASDAVKKPKASASKASVEKGGEKVSTVKAAATKTQRSAAQSTTIDAPAPKAAVSRSKSAAGSATKKASSGTLRIQQYRSVARTTEHQRRIMAGLGMGRIGRIRELPDNPCVRGMVAKVVHLVRVLEEAAS